MEIAVSVEIYSWSLLLIIINGISYFLELSSYAYQSLEHMSIYAIIGPLVLHVFKAHHSEYKLMSVPFYHL